MGGVHSDALILFVVKREFSLLRHLQKLEAEHLLLSETAESSNKLAGEAAVAVENSKSSLMKMQSDSIVFMKRIVDLEAKLLSISSKADGNGAADNEEDSYRKVPIEIENEPKMLKGFFFSLKNT